MEKSIEKVVVDSSCLIVLDNIGYMGILQQTFKTVLIPPAVNREFGRSFNWLRIDSSSSLSQQENDTLSKVRIGPGEREAITLALFHKDAALILDDLDARNIAMSLGLESKVLGTLGLLLKAKEKKIIHNVKPLLDDLLKIGFRMTEDLYNRILYEAKE
jgi:predicted nucleic acid-binding protein